ncbi:hypothetical protein ABZZ20_02050 [Streptomyces sp. NPDC006430]|uniref:hypothetical protein n=1 Tax=Streptomyces sp. NPDC006430 TaxID=3154299 RepID=UPI0033ABA486
MRPLPPAHGPADCVQTWIREARRDPAGAGYGVARNAIFDAVRADRAGPVAVRLLASTTDARGDVRLLLLRLLTDLCGSDGAVWPEAASAAVARLRDPDEPVRRAAAWLLAEADHRWAEELLTGPGPEPRPERGPERGSERERAGPAPDAVVRLALAEALLLRPTVQVRQRIREALRSDRDPAIRLRAAPRPDTDAVLADLDAGGARLGGPGGRVRWAAGTVWGLAARSGAEETCYEHVGLLTARTTAVAQRAAVDMAEEALREWRAAPRALAPQLRPLLGPGTHPEVRAAAAAVVGAPLESARLCAGELADLLDELPRTAAPALARIGDARALAQLSRLVAEGTPGPELADAATGLADAGVDVGPLVAAAAAFLDRHEDGKKAAVVAGVGAAVGVLRACGPAAAAAVPQVLRLLGPDEDAAVRTRAVLALGAMGPGAAAAVPLLAGLAGRLRTRFEGHVEMTLVRITGDRRRAERVFVMLPEGRRNLTLAADLLRWLAGHGGLDPHHVAYLREAAARPEQQPVHPVCVGTLWQHEGPAAVELALDLLPRFMGSDLHGPYVCRVLGDMGASAAPAVPALREVAERRVRVPMCIGDSDQEVRADERLAGAAREALRRIGDATAGRDRAPY